jgi:hypothetical protein
MAITIVGTAQADSALNGNDVTLTFDGTPAEDDLVVLVGGNGNNDADEPVGPSTAGYTQQGLHQRAGFATGVWTKFLGASPDASVVCQGGGDNRDAVTYACVVLRGVDATTPLDATIVETGESTADPINYSGITTVTDGAWVIVGGSQQKQAVAGAAPTGYSNLGSAGRNDTNAHGSAIATKEIATAGAEDPGDWTWNAGDAWYGFTIAIRPAGAGGDDTATPATVAVAAGIPQVTVTASAEKLATAVGVPAAVPAAAVTASVEKPATAVDVPSAVPQPTVPASVEKDATTVSAPAAVPLPTVTGSGDAAGTPAAVEAPAAVPQPSVSASVEQAATPVDVVTAIPQATITASAEKAVAAVSVSTGIPTASLSASVNVSAQTITIVADIPSVTVLFGAALAITALSFAQFHRLSGNLVLSPIGRSARRGFRTSEGFERVSDVFQIDNHPDGEATTEDAMLAVASAWAAHSGASEATLKAAIHSALDSAGFRAHDGTSLD